MRCVKKWILQVDQKRAPNEPLRGIQKHSGYRSIRDFLAFDNFLVMKPAERLLKKTESTEHQVLLHSDQGVQYSSAGYCNLLTRYNAIQSWGRFKDTLKKHFRYWEKDDLMTVIGDCIHYFNYIRPVRKTRWKTTSPVSNRTGGLTDFLCLLTIDYFKAQTVRRDFFRVIRLMPLQRPTRSPVGRRQAGLPPVHRSGREDCWESAWHRCG